MGVLCVVAKYWPAFQFGGLISCVYYLNKTLVKKGVDVTVYTTNVGLEGKVSPNREINLDGVKVNYFTFTRFFEFMGSNGWQFSRQITCALKNNLKDFDLIYILEPWSYPAVAAVYYSRKHKLPYMIVPQGMLYPYAFSQKICKKWPYYQLVIRKNLEAASVIQYTTEDEAEKTHSFLGLTNRAIIIPNAIDLLEFSGFIAQKRLRARYPHLKDKKIILFLSRIHWIKGLDILVQAFARLAKERKDLHLLIIGGDKDRYSKVVKKWIRKYQISEDVTFGGMLTGREKLEAYADSDIFVLPSYSDNFGIVAAEAMASRLPVVISNRVGIYREVERNKAGIVIDANTESLYRAVKLLLENSELRKEIAAKGRKLVEEYYDVEKVADKMIKTFEEILAFSRKNAR